MFIWRLWKRIDNRADKIIEWLAELTFRRPSVGLPLSLGIIGALILFVGFIASSTSVAVDVNLGNGMGNTFSHIGEVFSAWLPALLVLGLLLFASGRIMKRVNANRDSKNGANEKTSNTPS